MRQEVQVYVTIKLKGLVRFVSFRFVSVSKGERTASAFKSFEDVPLIFSCPSRTRTAGFATAYNTGCG